MTGAIILPSGVGGSTMVAVRETNSLVLFVVAAVTQVATAEAAFNQCRPLIGMEAQALRSVEGEVVNRWTTSTTYAVARVPAGFIYAQEPCWDVRTIRNGPGGWNGTVSLRARDVSTYEEGQGRWRSVGPQDVEAFDVSGGLGGWRFDDIGRYGRHDDPRGAIPSLPTGGGAPVPLCAANEAPDASGRCVRWRR